MAEEIERKFLLASEDWRNFATHSERYRQGYLTSSPEVVVRLRLSGERGMLTIKGATRGITRSEYEYEIPADDAAEMLDALCPRPLIEKERFFVPLGRHLWEIDVFSGDNEGLVVAEIELGRADEAFDRPGWLGREVSGEPRYYNASLARYPYRRWQQEERLDETR